MRSYKTLMLLGLFALLLGMQALAFPAFPFTLNKANAAYIDIWWPEDGSTLSGTQPFKAMLQDWSVRDYDMFWSVDGGQLNFMESNWQDWPHKEASVDVSGWNWRREGSYTLTFIATDLNGSKIAERSISVFAESDSSVLNAEPEQTSETPVLSDGDEGKESDKKQKKNKTLKVIEPEPEPEPEYTSTQPHSSGDPFSKPLYIDPNHPAKWQADAWRDSWPHGARMLDKISSKSGAKWFGGWNGDIFADVKAYVDEVAGAGALPVMIAYNIPQRDCGSYSAGGAGSPDAYRNWIGSFASAIGTRDAVVILEPDGLSGMDCLSGSDRETRTSLLREAVNTFNAQGNVSVYIDAGHSAWHSADEMAQRLRDGGIEAAEGFALNVSNYFWTADNVNYGTNISSQLGGKHFVVDTSRNGNGPTADHQWCNPEGRALGQPPTTSTGNPLVDAYLWLKVPGESDGTCNGGPSAGVFWPEYAVGLAERANW